MQTYNGMHVPDTINPGLIISAFQNAIDPDKVEEYTTIMKGHMLSHCFPPIMGYPCIIDENDIGQDFMSGEEITEDHIGLKVWKVTDGHHRTLAAIEARLPYIETTLDWTTITDEADRANFDSRIGLYGDTSPTQED